MDDLFLNPLVASLERIPLLASLAISDPNAPAGCLSRWPCTSIDPRRCHYSTSCGILLAEGNEQFVIHHTGPLSSLGVSQIQFPRYYLYDNSAHLTVIRVGRRAFFSRGAYIERRSLGERTVCGMLIAFPVSLPMYPLPGWVSRMSTMSGKIFASRARLRRDSALPVPLFPFSPNSVRIRTHIMRGMRIYRRLRQREERGAN